MTSKSLCLLSVFVFIPARIWASSDVGIPQIEHVIVIGVDGLGAYLANGHAWQTEADLPSHSVVEDHMPELWDVMNRGNDSLNAAWTFRLLNRRETSSGINWAALWCGAGSSLTGIGGVHDKGNSAAINRRSRVPHIFRVFKEQRPDSLVYLVGHRNNVGVGLVRGTAFDIYEDRSESQVAATMVARLMVDPPALSYCFFVGVDLTGHNHGWGSTQYLQALSDTDTRIRDIIDGVKAAGLEDKTLVVITADHGGGGLGDTSLGTGSGLPYNNHGHNTPAEHLVPLIFIGPDNVIVQGEMSSPGNDLLDDRAQRNDRNLDVAPTLAAVLGIRIPENWQGRVLSRPFTKFLHEPELSRPFINAAFQRTTAKNYLFNGRIYERFSFTGAPSVTMHSGYPLKFSLWRDIPWQDSDAAIYRYLGGDRAIFFKGDEYAIYDLTTDRMVPGYPKPLALWGITWPDVDAAVNTGNDEVFFFRGKDMVTFDLNTQTPINGQHFKNVFPGIAFHKIDAAMKHEDTTGRYIYLFRNTWYYRYKDVNGAYELDYGPAKITTEKGGRWEGLKLRDYQ